MFTAEQNATLRALIDRLIPPDDYPGGWEAGVGDYLARQFTRDLAAHLPIYRSALDALEQEAQLAHQQPFAALSVSQQDDILKRIEIGDVAADWAVDPSAFFRDACAHAAEGFYSDPGNGGNRDQIACQVTA
jgi:hypothetical protein